MKYIIGRTELGPQASVIQFLNYDDTGEHVTFDSIAEAKNHCPNTVKWNEPEGNVTRIDNIPTGFDPIEGITYLIMTEQSMQ